MKKKLRVGFVIVTVAAIPLVVQHHIHEKIRLENRSLRTQVRELEAAIETTERLSNRVAKTEQSIAPEAMLELMRLRSEVGSLRIDKRELEKQREENRELREQIQKAQNELRAALTESRSAAMKRLCVYHLRQIDGAKAQWAIENRKSERTSTLGLENEINAFLPKEPHCPEHGVYTYGPVGTTPTCSLGASAGHTL